MRYLLTFAFAACALSMLTAGCKNESVVAAERDARGGIDLPTAANRMVEAHCDVAERCAASAKPPARSDCRARLHDAMLGAFSPPTCGAGVVPGRLERCIAAIHHESCDTPLDSVTGLDACSVKALCP